MCRAAAEALQKDWWGEANDVEDWFGRSPPGCILFDEGGEEVGMFFNGHESATENQPPWRHVCYHGATALACCMEGACGALVLLLLPT